MWQTRTICTFVAATVPVETAGEVSPLLEEAQKIGQPPGEQAAQDKQPTGAAEPRVGSYEAFLGSFASPTRWAGR